MFVFFDTGWSWWYISKNVVTTSHSVNRIVEVVHKPLLIRYQLLDVRERAVYHVCFYSVTIYMRNRFLYPLVSSCSENSGLGIHARVLAVVGVCFA